MHRRCTGGAQAARWRRWPKRERKVTRPTRRHTAESARRSGEQAAQRRALGAAESGRRSARGSFQRGDSEKRTLVRPGRTGERAGVEPSDGRSRRPARPPRRRQAAKRASRERVRAEQRCVSPRTSKKSSCRRAGSSTAAHMSHVRRTGTTGDGWPSCELRSRDSSTHQQLWPLPNHARSALALLQVLHRLRHLFFVYCTESCHVVRVF